MKASSFVLTAGIQDNRGKLVRGEIDRSNSRDGPTTMTGLVDKLLSVSGPVVV